MLMPQAPIDLGVLGAGPIPIRSVRFDTDPGQVDPIRFQFSADPIRPDGCMAPWCILARPIRFGFDSVPMQPDSMHVPIRSDFPIRCWLVLPRSGTGRTSGPTGMALTAKKTRARIRLDHQKSEEEAVARPTSRQQAYDQLLIAIVDDAATSCGPTGASARRLLLSRRCLLGSRPAS